MIISLNWKRINLATFIRVSKGNYQEQPPLRTPSPQSCLWGRSSGNIVNSASSQSCLWGRLWGITAIANSASSQSCLWGRYYQEQPPSWTAHPRSLVSEGDYQGQPPSQTAHPRSLVSEGDYREQPPSQTAHPHCLIRNNHHCQQRLLASRRSMQSCPDLQALRQSRESATEYRGLTIYLVKFYDQSHQAITYHIGRQLPLVFFRFLQLLYLLFSGNNKRTF